MSDSRYSPFSDRPLSRSSTERSRSSSILDRYDRRGSLTPDRYLSWDDRRADWMLRGGYDDRRRTPFDRDRQLVPLPGKHAREAWGPHFSHRFSSYSDTEGGWSGGGFDVEDRRYCQDERRREVYEWGHIVEPRIPGSGVRYVGSGSVQRRYPHITGYRARCAIDGELREWRGVGYRSGYGYVFGYERYIAGLGGLGDIEAELVQGRCLGGYTIRRRRYLR
ncbi:hypothetical protein C7212DRAFT_348102 [Tuber magnatum]|uniref:Uncharacterized protein n=1 Tax=Tuber magnatum TaxID=42249 RepID=A0A317SDH6_9PEZI|nr:hypothetical protein C7212DRAFT_348102 [Tuber magnatum]